MVSRLQHNAYILSLGLNKMQRKYQVFISSTYNDLVEERRNISKAVLDMDHIPAGMETFFSADEEQFSYIKKRIDLCDYYILVIAGKYGSTDETGASYTEKEYDYAVRQKKVVLAFIHADIAQLSIGNVEADQEKLARLNSFREKVKTGRLVSFWKERLELQAQVIISLHKAISESPGVGWVRGNAAANEDVLAQINEIRTENERLKAELKSLISQMKPQIPDLADLNDKFTIRYEYKQ
jgi:hypothetical protein